MPKRHIALLIPLAVASGFLGATLSHFVLHPESVQAQVSPQDRIEAKTIVAGNILTRSIAVLDEQSNIRAAITVLGGRVALGVKGGEKLDHFGGVNVKGGEKLDHFGGVKLDQLGEW